MFNNPMRKKFVQENEVTLGDKKVSIPKITPKRWKELFAVVDSLPNVLIQIAMAPSEDLAAYVLTGIDVTLDEMLAVTSVLTGIDKQYLNDEAGVSEVIEFFARTVEKNDLTRAVKNVKSLLPMLQSTETTENE
jgi:hypothetical protein